jgi:hypothetical protein
MKTRVENLVESMKYVENPSIREIQTASLAELCLKMIDDIKEMTRKLSGYEEEKEE